MAPSADQTSVLFLHSVPASVKQLLLKRASLLVYTPANEHFGIVPLEAMAAHVPVLAATSGGPTETVLDGQTGWLRDTHRPDDWATVMTGIVSGVVSDADLALMGRAGAEWVAREFNRDRMTQRIVDVFDGMELAVDRNKKSPSLLNASLKYLGIFLALAFGMLAACRVE